MNSHSVANIVCYANSYRYLLNMNILYSLLVLDSFVDVACFRCYQCWSQRWSPRGRPRGHILKSLALASKVKSLALASRPQVLKNWPVLGSRTALFFGMLKFCGAVEKFFGKRFLLEIA